MYSNTQIFAQCIKAFFVLLSYDDLKLSATYIANPYEVAQEKHIAIMDAL